MVLAVCMLLLSPLHVERAEAFPGIATVAAGSAAGGAAALGITALIKAVGIGTAALGLPGIFLVGAALGGAFTAMLGNGMTDQSGKGLAMGTMAAAGGAAVLSAGGFLFTPWVLIPAAAIGIGTLVYTYVRKPPGWGGPGDIRNNTGLNSAFFGPTYRSADPTAQQNRSFLDRARSVFDRNRRDDNLFGGSYVRADGTMYRSDDMYARIGNYLGGNVPQNQYGGGAHFYGPGYGNQGYFSPGAAPRTDRLGQVILGGNSRTQFVTARGSAQASAPQSSDGLKAAEAQRDAAYKSLVETLGKDGDAQAAMDSYQKASQTLDALKGP